MNFVNNTKKYQPGDWVMIRPDLEEKMYGSYGAVGAMVNYRGTITTVISIDCDSSRGTSYTLDGLGWAWTDEMLIEVTRKRAVTAVDRERLNTNTDKFFEILGEISDE